MEENSQQPKGNNMIPMVGAVIVVLLLVGAGTFLLVSNRNKTQSEMAMDDSKTYDEMMAESSESSMMEDENGVKTFTLEAGNFSYKPNIIKVNKGDKVKITIKAIDMMHDIVIDELGVRSNIIKSGESTSVEFTADKVGTFEFYCSVSDHRAQGMVGTLTIE